MQCLYTRQEGMLRDNCPPSSIRSDKQSPPPAFVLKDLLLLLFPRVGLRGEQPPLVFTLLSPQLLGLLPGRPAYGPTDLAEKGRLDGCGQLESWQSRNAQLNAPSTQYGHRKCARFTLPHALHLVSAVMSLRPLPAMNRWRFLRYDVFFFGTALRMPSHMSPSDGNDGSDSDGMASAANGVGRKVRKGCERRCRRGRFRTGRTGRLRAGSSACHSGGIGRARAMVKCGTRAASADVNGVWWAKSEAPRLAALSRLPVCH